MGQAEATAGLATHWGKYKAVLFWLFCEIKQDHQLGMIILQEIFTPPNSSVWGVCVLVLSHVWLFVIPWAVACQAPLSMEFPGKNTRVGSHSLLQGIFLTQGSNLSPPHWQVDPSPSQPPGEPLYLRNRLSQHIVTYFGQCNLRECEVNRTLKWPCPAGPGLFASSIAVRKMFPAPLEHEETHGTSNQADPEIVLWAQPQILTAVCHEDFVLACYTVKTDWCRKISAVSRREEKVWNSSLWVWEKDLTRGSNRVAE